MSRRDDRWVIALSLQCSFMWFEVVQYRVVYLKCVDLFFLCEHVDVASESSSL